MKLKEAIKDANKSLIELNKLSYRGGFKYGFTFIKQGCCEIWQGVKQLLATIGCLSIYLLLPIAYPLAVIIRMVKK